jgi:DNA-binding transcriptional ArsR family regulator
VLRIHFTAADLMRTRVAPTLGPLAETLFAARLLQRDDEGVLFDGWRRQARPLASLHTGLLRPLFGGDGHPLDLFTLTGPAGTLQEGLDALLAAPASQLRSELDTIAAQRTLPARVRALADGDRGALLELAAAIRDLHDAAIGRAWSGVRACLDAAEVEHGHVLATRGVERLLATLHPLVRWRPPVLEVATPNQPRDGYLQGRGLVLVPSVFCHRPMAFYSLADQAAPDLLAFPAVRNHADLAAALAPGDRHGRALVALLGRTRAAVLEAVGDGCTTTELASRVKVSVPSASQHAQVLRDAGLLVTRRAGRSVHHSLTVLGASLLEASWRNPPITTPEDQR